MRRQQLMEHRVRGRVWLVLAVIAGIGSLKVHDAVEARDDTRALRGVSDFNVAAEIDTSSPVSGGAVAALTPGVPSASREAPLSAAPVTIEDGPRDGVTTEHTAQQGGVANTETSERSDAVVTGDRGGAVVTSDRGGAVPGGVYTPPIYYLGAPTYGGVRGVDPAVVEVLPQPAGAGGTAATPSIEMAGGNTIGTDGAGGNEIGAAGAGGTSADSQTQPLGGVVAGGPTFFPEPAGAGGTAATPSINMAGGTSIGADGAGGTAIGAGGAGAISSAPAGAAFSGQSAFAVPTIAPNVGVPFVPFSYPFFFVYVPPQQNVLQ
jgi:hypothetical protein